MTLKHFDVDMVGKLDFVTWVTTILIPDLFCHIVIVVNMAIKFRQFQKKSLVFHVMPNNFRCTDWRPDSCIFTNSIYMRSHQRTTPNAEQIFFADSKTELGAFLPPSAIGGLSTYQHNVIQKFGRDNKKPIVVCISFWAFSRFQVLPFLLTRAYFVTLPIQRPSLDLSSTAVMHFFL